MGIIVGCDQSQEWLLPWWWHHYSTHNAFPVAFVDFGMSERAVAWCDRRGTYLALPPKICPIKSLSPEEHKRFSPHFEEGVWVYREAVFKKAFACLRAPFALSCWIDVDCEIRGPLDPLWTPLQLGMEIALVREPDGSCYNSGVIAFRRKSKILSQWANLSRNANNQFLTDQEALSHAIDLHKPSMAELPATYNWKRSQGPNNDALILHYASGYWKDELRKIIYSFQFKGTQED